MDTDLDLYIKIDKDIKFPFETHVRGCKYLYDIEDNPRGLLFPTELFFQDLHLWTFKTPI